MFDEKSYLVKKNCGKLWSGLVLPGLIWSGQVWSGLVLDVCTKIEKPSVGRCLFGPATKEYFIAEIRLEAKSLKREKLGSVYSLPNTFVN